MSEKVKKIKKERRWRSHADLRNGLLFCSVWLVGFAVLTLYPLIQTLIFSFNDVIIRNDATVQMTAVKLLNYSHALLKDVAFTKALGDYVTKIVLYVPVITVVSLTLAMLLNSRLHGTGVFRTIYFLPVIIASGPVINMFISQGVAQFPGVSELINFESLASTVPEFLVTALKFLTEEFIMILWYSGIQILIFITGLQKIDKSMFEAAKVDGASKWEMFWKIILPSISPTIVINIVFTVIMQSVFSLNPVIMKINADMNGSGEFSGYGYASAMAWIYFVALALLLGAMLGLFKLLFMRKRGGAR